jgi:hypothetical protein
VNITANAVHPGLIMTNLFKHSAILMSKYVLIIRSMFQYSKSFFLVLEWPDSSSFFFIIIIITIIMGRNFEVLFVFLMEERASGSLDLSFPFFSKQCHPFFFYLYFPVSDDLRGQPQHATSRCTRAWKVLPVNTMWTAIAWSPVHLLEMKHWQGNCGTSATSWLLLFQKLEEK